MPARLYACAADARAPQPAVCQAPIGAIGFRPPTARLRLRRPSEARSAERGADANPAARAPPAFRRAGAASCQAPLSYEPNPSTIPRNHPDFFAVYECYVCIVLFGLANGAKVSLVSGTYLSHLM
jgi:hypothetical protein